MVDFKDLAEKSRRARAANAAMQHFTWSPQATAVFDAVKLGANHAVVRARAGSGKTTIVLKAMDFTGEREVILCAFNRPIADELTLRKPKDRDIESRTINSLGYQTLRDHFGEVGFDEDKGLNIARQVCSEIGAGRGVVRLVKRLADLGKTTIGVTAEALQDAAIHEHMDEDGERPEELSALAMECLKRALHTPRLVDYNDQVWIPAQLGIRPRRFHVVMIDELQDLNAPQLWLCRKSVRKGGMILGVGDDRQSIYGWRGADINAMGNIASELRADVFPLPVSYRCARSIIQLAKTIVPDIEAAPNAIEGEVLSVPRGRLLSLQDGAKPGDFVLSRTKAPLMSICLHFLRHGIPAVVAGRSIGRDLTNLARRSACSSVPALVSWLRDFRAREIERLTNLEREHQIPEVTDRIEALLALTEGFDRVDMVAARIEEMFTDDDTSERIVCSTTHKAKGLEKRRVWLVRNTFRSDRNIGEANIYYVAITRAKEALYLVEQE